MTPHIEAQLGDYADLVLMPGDPLRAQHLAKTFLSHCQQVNSVRNCLGFTGRYKNRRVSIQASGMGQASLAIYATELFKFYDVNTIVRMGTCGSLHKEIGVGTVILATAACTDSNMTANFCPGTIVNPSCDFDLLALIQKNLKIDHKVGMIASTDWFYNLNEQWWHQMQQLGALAVDMETHVLYFLSSLYNRKALTVNVVSDNLVTEQRTNSQSRVNMLDEIAEHVLDQIINE